MTMLDYYQISPPKSSLILTGEFFGKMLRKPGIIELFATLAAAVRMAAAFKLSFCTETCDFWCWTDCDGTLNSGFDTVFAETFRS